MQRHRDCIFSEYEANGMESDSEGQLIPWTGGRYRFFQSDLSGYAETPEEIKVISDYLKYVEYLEVWDGKLPTVMGGDSANVVVPVNPANPVNPQA